MSISCCCVHACNCIIWKVFCFRPNTPWNVSKSLDWRQWRQIYFPIEALVLPEMFNRGRKWCENWNNKKYNRSVWWWIWWECRWTTRCCWHKEDLSTGMAFLFAHQEGWQRQMLVKYGNTMTLLDATYKTTNHFFVVCKNKQWLHASGRIYCWTKNWNINCRSSTSYFWLEQRMEATLFYGWLYSIAELNGILTVFPSADVCLYEFHREQAWTRWIWNGIVYTLAPHACKADLRLSCK